MNHGHTIDRGARRRAGDERRSGCEHALGGGIGLSNVNERLQTIYGANYH